VHVVRTRSIVFFAESIPEDFRHDGVVEIKRDVTVDGDIPSLEYLHRWDRIERPHSAVCADRDKTLVYSIFKYRSEVDPKRHDLLGIFGGLYPVLRPSDIPS
jgi:hypothetical protein